MSYLPKSQACGVCHYSMSTLRVHLADVNLDQTIRKSRKYQVCLRHGRVKLSCMSNVETKICLRQQSEVPLEFFRCSTTNLFGGPYFLYSDTRDAKRPP